jgi:hypothetical protein
LLKKPGDCALDDAGMDDEHCFFFMPSELQCVTRVAKDALMFANLCPTTFQTQHHARTTTFLAGIRLRPRQVDTNVFSPTQSSERRPISANPDTQTWYSPVHESLQTSFITCRQMPHAADDQELRSTLCSKCQIMAVDHHADVRTWYSPVDKSLQASLITCRQIPNAVDDCNLRSTPFVIRQIMAIGHHTDVETWYMTLNALLHHPFVALRQISSAVGDADLRYCHVMTFAFTPGVRRHEWGDLEYIAA